MFGFLIFSSPKLCFKYTECLSALLKKVSDELQACLLTAQIAHLSYSPAYRLARATYNSTPATDNPQMDPAIEVVFCAHGYAVPKPWTVQDAAHDTIFSWGGVKIVRLSPTTVAKYGPHVSVVEAKTMIFVAKNAPTVPVPRIYCVYIHGPFDRDPDDFGSRYDTYIIMDHVAGDPLDKVWPKMAQTQKHTVMQQLDNHMQSLRGIATISEPYIGSVDYGPVTDTILENWPMKGCLLLKW